MLLTVHIIKNSLFIATLGIPLCKRLFHEMIENLYVLVFKDNTTLFCVRVHETFFLH